jgi:hypothetical protein
MQVEHMGLRQHEGNCNTPARPHIAHAFPEATRFSWRLARRYSWVLGADLLERLLLLLSEYFFLLSSSSSSSSSAVFFFFFFFFFEPFFVSPSDF